MMKLKLRGTDIFISFTLICVCAICIITGMFANFLCSLLAILFHESGHLFWLCKFGCPPDEIKISLFEIKINDVSRHTRGVSQNFLIIFFGPFVNFICFILFYLLYLKCNLFYPLAAANLCVGLFNSLPVISLDGGQLIYLFLTLRFTPEAAEKCVNIITFIFIFPLAALGFLVLFNSKYNFSLLFVCVYLIFSLAFKNNGYFDGG